MVNKLVCMMIVKNEADKYLFEIIENNLKFCDEVCILDDHSTDNTIEICKSFGERVFIKNAVYSWEQEWSLRNELLEFALERNPKYLISIDADEIYDYKTFLNDYKHIIDNDIKVVSFHFYDIWTEDRNYYRDDKYFSVGTGIRMCRSDSLKEYKWDEHRRHCGSLPSSIFNNFTYIANTKVKHLGYAKYEDRLRKYKEKILDDSKFEYYSKETYEAILDLNPNLINFKE